MNSTTTTPNPSPGSLKIENFLISKGIKFTRIDDERIIVTEYGNQQEKVALSVQHSSSENVFEVTAQNDIRYDSGSINPVLRFVNLVNSVPHLGCFYLCPHCNGLHFRLNQMIAVADLSDAAIQDAMENAFFMLIDAALHIHLIVDHGVTVDEAFKELMSSEDDDNEPAGGAQ